MYMIYKITNKLNSKSYIGQTSQTLSERIKQHIYNKTNIGKVLLNYGINNFDIQVLDISESKEKIDKAERYWIEMYDAINNGYNILKGGVPDKSELNRIKSFSNNKHRGHTRRWLRKKQIEKEEEFVRKRHEKFLKMMENEGKKNKENNKEHKENKENKENDKGSKKNSDTKINKFVEKELELARKLGIESYIKI